LLIEELHYYVSLMLFIFCALIEFNGMMMKFVGYVSFVSLMMDQTNI